MLDRYEWVLVGIPVALLAGAVVSLHPSVALPHGLAGGSLLASALLYDALFRNPPIDPGAAEVAVTAGVGVGWALTLLSLL
ncbi:hypothetical protein KY092_09325 [Natronomonas gomsonensis]|uniref:hypothetical protein n=1 Tax=Natronomonas gomsonensis TaxID=1046043 RepID=UPI0020CA8BBB|nr:hypothetical protein [Natronomonas gomsonensis]MCY4730756.1 hypothetical protein [Natronomonas gomsonensis]